ncbi:MAG TPA: hypothetical protein PKY59_17610 [Pyrinomonadaceae bacterium]|nr:hypothetical protein [Pyrinomonadaceae bacterium]
MKKFSLIFLLTTAFCSSVSAQSNCFVNGGLKDEHRVYLNISGAKVSGEFIVVRDYNDETRENFIFSGTKSGNNFNVKFAENKIPESFPPRLKSFLWTVVNVGDKEILKIKLYGKNSETGKYSVYTADYDSCEPSYSELFKTAKRVSFAKGASSAIEKVAFTAESERKTFLLNLRKGQKLSVEAEGCGISFYYPDKNRYEEGTAIDNWGSDSLLQSGDYLFVISPAGTPGTCSVNFKTF